MNMEMREGGRYVLDCELVDSLATMLGAVAADGEYGKLIEIRSEHTGRFPSRLFLHALW
jgi:hypothetical protein